jgi:hypothetical protein
LQNGKISSAIVLGLGLFLGLSALGGLLGRALVQFRALERTVTVKGLSEQERPADLALWPLQFVVAEDELTALYETMQQNQARIVQFLRERGFSESEISTSAPAIVDKKAQAYGSQEVDLRFTATQTVSVYTENVELVRSANDGLVELGKSGIVFSGDNYQTATEYIFTGLNELKPPMIEEATKKAREVAEKFAQDSSSRLGKIKRASQGQFSISDRDRNTPYIKKIRVVTTIEYYLVD